MVAYSLDFSSVRQILLGIVLLDMIWCGRSSTRPHCHLDCLRSSPPCGTICPCQELYQKGPAPLLSISYITWGHLRYSGSHTHTLLRFPYTTQGHLCNSVTYIYSELSVSLRVTHYLGSPTLLGVTYITRSPSTQDHLSYSGSPAPPLCHPTCLSPHMPCSFITAIWQNRPFGMKDLR